jgi:hypothetical protein
MSTPRLCHLSGQYHGIILADCGVCIYIVQNLAQSAIARYCCKFRVCISSKLLRSKGKQRIENTSDCKEQRMSMKNEKHK